MRRETRPSTNSTVIMIVIISVAAVIVLGLACAGVLFLALVLSRPVAQGNGKEPIRRAMLRDEFKALVLSAKDKEDLIAKIGRPETTRPAGQFIGEDWSYRQRSVDPITDRVDTAVHIEFDLRNPQRVKNVRFTP